MNEIIALLSCFEQCLPVTMRRQMTQVMLGILRMTGRVTMLGIARWTETGGSYRTVQRFFHSVLPWAELFWLFFKVHLLRPEDEYILAGDESVITKAGKKTYGLDRFFSSIYGKPVPGLALFALSLINVNQERSTPLLVEQVLKSESEKKEEVAKTKAKAKKKEKPGQEPKKPGRPKGSKNKDKTNIELTAELTRIDGMVGRLLSRIAGHIPIHHLVMDGHFGNNNALQMVRKQGLHLVSKLRHDSALYFSYEGEQKPAGARKRYGDKINYRQIPVRYRVSSTIEKQVRTEIYQATMLHSAFAGLLNVVVIVKFNLKTNKYAHVVLFSSDLQLSAEKLIRYYQLRFQIESNFRDAKQFWGMEDFMVLEKQAVTNAINLSLFMVLVSQRLLVDFRQLSPQAGILDLKAYFRGRFYASETLKLLPQKPEPILFQHIFDTIVRLGCIHAHPFIGPPLGLT